MTGDVVPYSEQTDLRATLHHVMIAIPVKGESIARQFYGDVLGFREIPKPASLAGRGGLWFSIGDLELHLGIDRVFVPARKAHVALYVANLEAAQARLVEFGYPISADSNLDGFVRLYVDDPFGNRLEFLKATDEEEDMP